MHEKLISSGSGIIKDLAYVIGSFCCAFGSLTQLNNDDRVSVSRGLLFSKSIPAYILNLNHYLIQVVSLHSSDLSISKS